MKTIRMCVACRKQVARAELLRVIARDGNLLADCRGVLPGRGAWVHESAKCLSLALRRGVFARALRVSGQLDASPLENRLKTLMEN